MSFQKLIDWSQKEFPELPWRKKRSLYRTLVSEIMLQQTTVSTVKNHYDRFLKEFPTLESLAKASEEELIVAWKGLGYYRRARNLKKIAESLFLEHKGEFPTSLESLQEIPGIGPYTAGALLSIGMDEKALAVDANLERVIARYYGLETQKGLKLQKEIQSQFNNKKILQLKLSYRALNEALMDLGRTFCQARKASCDLCPLKKECMAFQSKKPLSYPREEEGKVKLKAQEHELHLLRVIVQKKEKVLAYKKSDEEWLHGQFEVPTFMISTTDKKLSQYPTLKNKISLKELPNFKTSITKYKITNFVLTMTEKEFRDWKTIFTLDWKEVADPKSNFSTATIKSFQKIKLI